MRGQLQLSTEMPRRHCIFRTEGPFMSESRTAALLWSAAAVFCDIFAPFCDAYTSFYTPSRRYRAGRSTLRAVLPRRAIGASSAARSVSPVAPSPAPARVGAIHAVFKPRAGVVDRDAAACRPRPARGSHSLLVRDGIAAACQNHTGGRQILPADGERRKALLAVASRISKRSESSSGSTTASRGRRTGSCIR
jgi:hypothetical protein